jgi:oxygen-independent coproporphyrinogen-3 oxidase
MVRDVLLGMKLLRLDLKKFQKRHGFRLESLCSDLLTKLQREDFITISQQHIELTAKGILYGDYVGQTLADYIKNMN